MMALPVGRPKGRGFHPRLAQTLGFLALLPILLGLGVWQLQRAAEKTALVAALDEAREAPPVRIDDLSLSALPQRVQVGGRFAAEQFLLDNRVSNGHAGYEHLAPLVLSDGSAVLVDLGWVAGGQDRRVLPRVQAPAGAARLTGLALAPSPPVFHLSDREAFGEGWPLVVQTAEPARLATRLHRPLRPVVLYPDGSEALSARLAGLVAFPPERHQAYAAQWFAMAMILIALYGHHGFTSAPRA